MTQNTFHEDYTKRQQRMSRPTPFDEMNDGTPREPLWLALVTLVFSIGFVFLVCLAVFLIGGK